MAQPLLPEPRERPHLAELNDDPHPAAPRQRPHLAGAPGRPGLPGQPGQPGQAGQPDQPGPAGREERALLPEPPERPVTGVRQVPAFRGRRPASGEDENADGQDSPMPNRGAGYTVLSYLIAGMMAYGAIGWLISRAVHQTIIFPVGMLFGLGLSLGFVIYRYGRSSSTQNQHAKETPREEPPGDR